MVSSVITPALKRWRQTDHQGWMTIHHLLAGQYHVIQDPISNKQQKRWNRRHDRQGGPPVPTCTCVYKDTQEYTPQKWLRMASLVFISYTTNMATLKYSWMILLALVKALEFHYCLSHSNPKLHNAPKSSFFFFIFGTYMMPLMGIPYLRLEQWVSNSQHTGTLKVPHKIAWSLWLYGLLEI